MVWFACGLIASSLWLGWQAVPTFVELGILCGLNLFSMGKVFANLAGAVSSVDPNKKLSKGVGAAVWGGIKLASLFGIVLLLVAKQNVNNGALILGISGWIIVPCMLGWLSRPTGESKEN